jgi:hypothetical protein
MIALAGKPVKPVYSFSTLQSSLQRPTAYLTLPFGVLSHGDHSAVGLKPHSMCGACNDHGVNPNHKAGSE